MLALSRFIAPRIALAGFAVLALIGCKKPTVRVYLAPRDVTPPNAEATAPAHVAMPELHWTLPQGWKETGPGQMSLASFSIEDANGSATVNVTPLPNLEGREEAVVNMWREQVELGPLSAEEVAKALEPTEIAGGKGFSLKSRALAVANPPGHSPPSSIAGIAAGSSSSPATTQPCPPRRSPFSSSSNPCNFTRETTLPSRQYCRHSREGHQRFNTCLTFRRCWFARISVKVPDAWQKVSPGQMQVAKFTVPEKTARKPEVSVSVFPSDTGGTLANVNRWRKQLGLSEVDEAGLKSCVTGLDAAPGAVLVTLTNEQRQMLGAIVRVRANGGSTR
jgi:hypothetical protein